MVSVDFYKTKSLDEMNAEEWEALCDGCGRCCYRKFITGRGKREKLHFTRIACDLLDVKTGKCTDYCNRFRHTVDCIRLTKKNLLQFNWLPETCAYRLVANGEPLPSWHPLVSGRMDSVQESGIQIAGGVHESDVDEADWEDYEIK